ncbi:hypothetical protein B0T18DRAFT_230849 [Schizothecium vesticola]|uniref:Uncharacterized protein n=1 Tax=Schizothecium vesticola TaxID=314040 RepID=A0AA40EL90_9PEZI|nr:hypothetical protein B0T18DRAFT_230849 [Schizothecium vesticola]
MTPGRTWGILFLSHAPPVEALRKTVASCDTRAPKGAAPVSAPPAPGPDPLSRREVVGVEDQNTRNTTHPSHRSRAMRRRPSWIPLRSRYSALRARPAHTEWNPDTAILDFPASPSSSSSHRAPSQFAIKSSPQNQQGSGR